MTNRVLSGRRWSWILTLVLERGFGLAALLVVLFIPHLEQAQTLQVLYSFAGGPDGGGPFAGLVTDDLGNLYGTTNYGGSPNCSTDIEEGCGTIFKVGQNGKHTVLHRFTGGHDQRNPYAGLIRDKAGDLYGTTAGRFVDNMPPYGTVFRLGTNGRVNVLYSFQGGSFDGAFCTGGLVRDAEGNFYGVTDEGGKFGFGTVFKIDKSGKEAVLHSFGNAPDAQDPLYETLALDSTGYLYGTTWDGGAFNQGAVFKVNIATGKEEVLHSFANGTDGGLPSSGLILDEHGDLYGTTSQGGGAGAGTIFKVSPSGKETILYRFAGGPDGVFPQGTLVRDKKGNLYGATLYGGAHSFGSIFKVTSRGKETLLHSFNMSDGDTPWGGVIRDPPGNLYGTTATGGKFNFGTVFKLIP